MPKALRILVTGATGFLGRTLCDLEVPGVAFIKTARQPPEEPGWLLLDVTDGATVQAALRAARPDWVIHTAAVTGVDRCEEAPDIANTVHVDATRVLAEACSAQGCGLAYLSTNYVFDGLLGPYAEDDATRPLNVYGRTKLEGEGYVLGGLPRGLVARTAVVYGFHARARPNFVTWVAGALGRGERIRVVTDEWANPTPVSELASGLVRACQEGVTGLFHLAGGDFLTRMEMVAAVCEATGHDFALVTPVLSADLGQKAQRPLRAGLRIDRAVDTGLLSPRPFREHLRELVPFLRP